MGRAQRKPKREPDDPLRRMFVAKVQSNSERSFNAYTITIRDGNWECACRAWTTQVPRVDCKHIARVKESIVMITRHPDVNNVVGVHFGPTWVAFFTRNIDGIKRDAVMALLTLVDTRDNANALDTSGAWNTIIGIINDDAKERGYDV